MHPCIKLEERFGAHNYAPLPVVLARGKGVYLWDDRGRRYLDMMSAYSAVSLGHCHPRLVQTLHRQAETLDVVSRAFYTERLGPFLKLACETFGFAAAIPMNSGTEAVESALKAARKWAYTVKGVPAQRAEIIACTGNFHGRSISIVGFSSEDLYRDGFGPFPPGFKLIPFGDASALAAAITPNTAAFLVEPIQGEGGINVPPPGFLRDCARICRERNVLFLADEIQTGLGRTGSLLACDHDGVKPDGLMLGKALGGGLLPVSLFLCSREVMDVFTPGTHGSTFGGNPLAAAVGSEVLAILNEEGLCERAARLGKHFMRRLKAIDSPLIAEVRGKGLLLGLEVQGLPARRVCEALLDRGVLSKETHETVVRLAPPLIISRSQIDTAVEAIRQALAALS